MSTQKPIGGQSFIDRVEGGNRAVLVYIELFHHQFIDALFEFKELVRSAGAEVLAVETVKRSKPEVKYFIGSGKTEEIALQVKALKADLVIFSHDLSPSQERNLETILECRVLDRTGLILDIFSQRARTYEGKLQVELAQLKHISTRLVRGWTHLERQKGGIGLRGPGETQLETDRRLISVRIKAIDKRLKKVSAQRDLSRRARSRAEIATVSLVGYTNAGKSTLFNAIADANVYVQDQLFATLDPTLRKVKVPPLGPVIFADTVGFVRDLPHDLVAAFRATLEETRRANLLLHVIDAHHNEKKDLIFSVEQVLDEIGAMDVPRLEIYNKIDLRDDVSARIDRDDEGKPYRVWCSALTGEGLELIKEAIIERLADVVVDYEITLTPAQGKVRARLYDQGLVQSETIQENGDILLGLRLQRCELDLLLSQIRSV